MFKARQWELCDWGWDSTFGRLTCGLHSCMHVCINIQYMFICVYNFNTRLHLWYCGGRQSIWMPRRQSRWWGQCWHRTRARRTSSNRQARWATGATWLKVVAVLRFGELWVLKCARISSNQVVMTFARAVEFGCCFIQTRGKTLSALVAHNFNSGCCGNVV